MVVFQFRGFKNVFYDLLSALVSHLQSRYYVMARSVPKNTASIARLGGKSHFKIGETV